MEQQQVTSDFEIDCDWTSRQEGPREVADTACALKIRVDKQIVTRADNEFSGSVTDHPTLSAYPLAAWFAYSWWRLRWESGFNQGTEAPTAWRLAHEMPAAGMGLVWPPIRFESEGRTITAEVNGGAHGYFEPLRYLIKGQFRIDAAAFERAIDHFMSKVVTRLADQGIDSPLQSLWIEVKEERADPELCAFRRMEAILGYDPDNADEALIKSFLELRSTVGKSALDEIAHASSKFFGDSFRTLNQTMDAAAKLKPEGHIQLPAPRQKLASKVADMKLAPWDVGRLLAEEVRRLCGNPKSPISNRDLGTFFGIPPTRFQTTDSSLAPPLGLAVVQNEQIGVAFRKSLETGRRFEAARLLGDFILNADSDTWLPATDAATFRQKVQRAFATSFLIPLNSLLERLDGKINDESVHDAASHFDVSPLAVQSHLVNNRVPGAHLGEFSAA